MTPRTVLAASGLEVSRVCLGLSRLHHILMNRDRCRLIDEARGMGITHFDAARLYGDGIAERTLGETIKQARSSVTIATKCGLIPNDCVGSLGSAARPIWAARAVLRRLGKSRWPGRSFSADTMKQSLETSLRLMRTDYVDIQFLHEPHMSDMENNTALIDAMTAAKKAGKVRFFGLAGADHVNICAMYPGVFDVVQMPEAEWDPAARVPDFTYSVISAARSKEPGQRVSSETVRTLLATALARRPQGAILIGTTKVSHLRLAVDVSLQGAKA